MYTLTEENSTSNKRKAWIFTIAFHILLLIAFFFTVFVTPIPPFEIKPVPELEIGLGMEGLGNSDAGGSGNKDKDVTTTPPEKVEKAPEAVSPPEKADPESLLTDDDETESIKTPPVKKEKPKKKKVFEVVKPKEKPKVETPKIAEQKPSAELSNALAMLKNKKKFTGKGEGTGNDGGSGSGNNKGVGDGSGTGHGNGTPGYNGRGGYDLKGRSLIKRPSSMRDSEEEGVVVVEIIVDETGKVIKATPGQRGSTTTSANLYAKARQAAYEAKFNPSADGAKEQRGTYTFVFTLE